MFPLQGTRDSEEWLNRRCYVKQNFHLKEKHSFKTLNVNQQATNVLWWQQEPGPASALKMTVTQQLF